MTTTGIASDSNADVERSELIESAMADPRIAEAFAIFQEASLRVPPVVAAHAPVTYSSSGNS